MKSKERFNRNVTSAQFTRQPLKVQVKIKLYVHKAS